jgi:putative transposase
MGTRPPTATNEWYHCYNRGFEKMRVFKNNRDYERFLVALYLCNDTQRMHMREAKGWNLQHILEENNKTEREPLVDIGAYALMPNHIHLVIKQRVEGGIALFMQKVFTSYTMYFNKKYERTGSLFSGTFKSKHVPDDRYLKRLLPYVLLNPDKSSDTEYSSLPDFLGEKRPENKIVIDVSDLYDHKPSLAAMRKEAALFDLGLT